MKKVDHMESSFIVKVIELMDFHFRYSTLKSLIFSHYCEIRTSALVQYSPSLPLYSFVSADLSFKNWPVVQQC